MNNLIEVQANFQSQPGEASSSAAVIAANIPKSDAPPANSSSEQISQPITAPSEPSDGNESLLASASASDQSNDHIFGSVEFLAPWFPNVDPHKRTWKSRRSRRNVVIWILFASTLSIFLLNFIVTIVVWSKYPLSSDGVATLYQGDCSFAKRLDAGLHVLINVLSTILLSMSNLSLQLIVSPTRTEIDRAHCSGQWLDVGVPSIRNIRILPRTTIVVAVLLAFSALPIHFLYNATIFSTVSANSFMYATVTEAFLYPPSDGVTFVLENGSTIAAPTDINRALHTVTYDKMPSFGSYQEQSPEAMETLEAIHRDVQINLPKYQRLSNYACLSQYSNPYILRSNVLLVSKDYETALEFNTSLLVWQTQYPSSATSAGLDPIVWSKDWANQWQAVSTLNESIMDDWKSRGYHVQYCLQVPDASAASAFSACRVQCAPSVLLVTSIFNFIKCIGVLWLFYGRPQHTICTLGDAIASFLEYPDAITEKLGIATSNSLVRATNDSLKHAKGGPQLWLPRDIRWFNAGSKGRWWFTMTTSIITLSAGLVIFTTGLAIIKRYYHSIAWGTLWDVGWGTTTYKELIEWDQPKTGKSGLFANIIIANIWQVLVSLCYVAQNALLSCQLVADEWTGFARERKTLRVSHPVGIQRSTYFVSMPLRYGMPIMALFSLEHWLLSQTTFVIRVLSFDFTTTPFTTLDGWTTSGFSIIPAIFAIALPALLLIAQSANAFFRKYPATSAMPLVSTCSLAISANCQRPRADTEAHLLPVQWGVIEKCAEGVQKCSFTTLRTVKAPMSGEGVLALSDEKSSSRSALWSSRAKAISAIFKYIIALFRARR